GGRARRFRCCLPDCDFFGHDFSPFLPRFSRGTQGEWGLLARPRAAFLEGPERRSQNPEGPARRESRSPPCRQGAGGFPQLAVPARGRGVRKGKWPGKSNKRQQEGTTRFPEGRAEGSRPTQQQCFHEKTGGVVGSKEGVDGPGALGLTWLVDSLF